MADALISLEAIAKFRDGKPVLRGVNLTIAPGEAHLILGANGAGKSTLLRIMAGLMRPSAGKIKQAEELTVAYLGHPTFLYNGLTAMQNLRFQARIYKLKTADADLLELLRQVDLAPHAHTKARAFSRGMAQRLNFCRALLLSPQLYLLDEPFTGMDAASRQTMRQELERRRQQGKSIVLVSHDPEADGALANHSHRLAQGKLQDARPC